MSEQSGIVLLAITVNAEGGERLRLAPADSGLLSNPVVIKEGVQYSLGLEFRVNHGDTAGVRCAQVVKRANVTVDKLEEVLGSYGPSPDEDPYKKELAAQEAPTGLQARSGSYKVRSRIIADDATVYADFEWSYKLAKDWQ
ncbi:RHO protein GDP dissociation inhibitor [Streptomyces sp. 2132.2]|uniref:hypothetical protein n=1 Tax=Streptomyces sp. 2132.2 TaxID=2485161 RepID=UPI000F46AFF6|nr:hypothetical protein [Streptomyces sp. 2132.2]ROQ93720.1 RHO protein GDP dissociation inhibitor [Streptomyces sp. 2132.2]